MNRALYRVYNYIAYCLLPTAVTEEPRGEGLSAKGRGWRGAGSLAERLWKGAANLDLLALPWAHVAFI